VTRVCQAFALEDIEFLTTTTHAYLDASCAVYKRMFLYHASCDNRAVVALFIINETNAEVESKGAATQTERMFHRFVGPHSDVSHGSSLSVSVSFSLSRARTHTLSVHLCLSRLSRCAQYSRSKVHHAGCGSASRNGVSLYRCVILCC
jgi:hypothetical protein